MYRKIKENAKRQEQHRKQLMKERDIEIQNLETNKKDI